MNLKQRLEALRKEGLELANKETALSADERTRLDAILVEVNDLQKQVTAQETLSAGGNAGDKNAPPANANQNPPPAGGFDVVATANQVVAEAEKLLNARLEASPAAVKGLLFGGGNSPYIMRYGLKGDKDFDKEAPIAWAVKALREKRYDHAVFMLGKMNEGAIKALAEGTDTAGGYLVPVEQSNQLVPLLRAKSVVRRTGARVIPMKSNTLEMPKQTGGATAYWVGENSVITDSSQSFGQMALSAKKLAALTKLPKELFEDSDPEVEAIVREDLATVLALEEDIKFLRGDGTNNTPVGLRNLGATVTEIDANGAVPTFDMLRDAKYRLDADNVPEEGRAWIMHPRTLSRLEQAKINSEANHYAFVFPAQAGQLITIWGYPVFMTTAIPINLAVGSETAASEIYLGAWGEAIIGQRKTLELRASDEAGNAFEYDQVFIRALMRVDFNIRHVESFEILTGVAET